MATLHEYSDKDGFYVKHSFVSSGKLVHVVYQTTERAINLLRSNDIRDGDTIPPSSTPLFPV